MYSAKTFVLANIHTDTFPCQEIKSVTPSLYLRQSKFGYANMDLHKERHGNEWANVSNFSGCYKGQTAPFVVPVQHAHQC